MTGSKPHSRRVAAAFSGFSSLGVLPGEMMATLSPGRSGAGMVSDWLWMVLVVAIMIVSISNRVVRCCFIVVETMVSYII